MRENPLSVARWIDSAREGRAQYVRAHDSNEL